MKSERHSIIRDKFSEETYIYTLADSPQQTDNDFWDTSNFRNLKAEVADIYSVIPFR